jgi:hypothetical protein
METPVPVLAHRKPRRGKGRFQQSRTGSCLRARYREVAADPVPMTPAEFKAIAQRERTVFGQLIRDQGLKAE